MSFFQRNLLIVKIHSLKSFLFLVLFVFLFFSPASVLAFSECLSTLSDPDGDGYGFESGETCLVTSSSSSQSLGCIDEDGDGWGWDGTSSCRVESISSTDNSGSAQNEVSGNETSSNVCVDTDGDGWGWDGSQSCLVDSVSSPISNPAAAPETTTSLPNVSSRGCYDDNNDGWGWDGVSGCRVVPSSIPLSEIIGGVTDVVLMAGQSNALGEHTLVDYLGEDSPSSNVIVWTQFNGWKIADLCSQAWDKGFYPWTNGDCSNHPGFQIAKHIVEFDPRRKVALIPTGRGSQPISWWDAGSLEMSIIDNKVEAALSALGGYPQVDFIAWSQGESDSGSEDLWFSKLKNLIFRFRAREWFDASNSIFIAQETSNSTINRRVIDLGPDGDPLTDWIQAKDLGTKDGVHWTGASLRVIGERFASQYLSIR